MDSRNFFVVALRQQKLLAIKKQWIENPLLLSFTKIFFSANSQKEPNFALETRYYFNKNCDACYDAYIIKSFGEF